MRMKLHRFLVVVRWIARGRDGFDRDPLGPPVEAAPRSSTFQEVTEELSQMSGATVVATVGDCGAGHVIAHWLGVLFPVEVEEDGARFILSLEGQQDCGIVLDEWAYVEGEARNGGVSSRFGSVEFMMNRLPAELPTRPSR
jgi:hypothetical protein